MTIWNHSGTTNMLTKLYSHPCTVIFHFISTALSMSQSQGEKMHQDF